MGSAAPPLTADGRPEAELTGHLSPLGTGPEPPGHPLEPLPQPLRVQAAPTYRQARLDELPLIATSCPLEHPPVGHGHDCVGGLANAVAIA